MKEQERYFLQDYSSEIRRDNPALADYLLSLSTMSALDYKLTLWRSALLIVKDKIRGWLANK